MVLETDQTSYRAAQYVRMSTEHQQYSTNNQADKILEYAQRRNIEIVRTYADGVKVVCPWAVGLPCKSSLPMLNPV